ncbi:MAG: Non-canonical purine NTP phosphatase [Proteobacteria bacterium]|nr:MAG: Non-canonical purine NTP phosphatase [Pseudomonadota bacterium]|tara:strand:+ start:160 stop:654 length:495 start_codon:yes stop_codon:yes gene_type:complete
MTIKIGIGTTSENKIIYLKQALKKLNILNFDIISIDAQSEIKEQPTSLIETIQGSNNRAKNTNNETGLDICFGLEGGLEFYEKYACYICTVSCLFKGSLYNGISSQLKIPNEVYLKIKNNEDLSESLNNYTPKNKNELTLKNMILSRQEMFEQALFNCLIQIDL